MGSDPEFAGTTGILLPGGKTSRNKFRLQNMGSLVAIINPLFLQMIMCLSTPFRRQLKVQSGKPHSGMKLTKEATEDWKTPGLSGSRARRGGEDFAGLPSSGRSVCVRMDKL